jgi:dolichol-phosphate mannosyltransferase
MMVSGDGGTMRRSIVYRNLRVMGLVPVLDEELKIGKVIDRVPTHVVDLTVVVDDGSTDSSPDVAGSKGAHVIELGETLGVGAALRSGFAYAIGEGYDVVVVMAGNNKDSPEEIPLLLDRLIDGPADIVQGSRWLGESTDYGDMPMYRRVATRLHPTLFNLISPTKLTDTTNGFRAVRTSVLADPGLDLDQRWLDQYELEVYLLYKSLKLGYEVSEVGVTKRYPPKDLGQTKMKPITGWWSILRPLVLLGLHIKH